jgi:hypothetical protein
VVEPEVKIASSLMIALVGLIMVSCFKVGRKPEPPPKNAGSVTHQNTVMNTLFQKYLQGLSV